MAAGPNIVVIGAGIGGLAAALRLAHAGCDVTVIERHGAPGGKLRTVPSEAGPVDAGPTVLTLRGVFEALFADVGERLADHVTLVAEPVLARHYWSDGTRLDLMADTALSAANVGHVFGARAESQFRRFSDWATRLFDGFDKPMLQTAVPKPMALVGHVARRPALAAAMLPPRTLAAQLNEAFDEPKLAQLFGRYATYVGGSPYASPAILGLIWSAEARGVWRVEDGMHRMAHAIEALAKAKGARFHYGTDVEQIAVQGGRVVSVTAGTTRFAADAVVFNGDPAALAAGVFGTETVAAVPKKSVTPRSLSAAVHAFAAEVRGPELAHHTVFFGDDPCKEFDALAQGRMPEDPTLYICAQDRGAGQTPPPLERFEIIMNAPPTSDAQDRQETALCQRHILERLARFGLRFSPEPGPADLTMPRDFAALFPQSDGALYGRSPRGMMAAFARPTARTAVRGLYLTGGGATPGAGVPMATLSARHAAEAILQDRTSILTSHRTAMPGGMSTASATTEPAPFRSSAS